MGVLTGRNHDDLQRAVAACKDREELFVTLDCLSRRASEVLARNRAKAAEVKLLAGYVAEIRRLLRELSNLSVRPGHPAALREGFRVLAERYLELEGMVKELRNDLAAS